MNNVERKTVVILEGPDTFEVWGSLVKACGAHPDFSYEYIKSKKFPFKYKGWRFYRVRFNDRNFAVKNALK